MVVQTYLKKLTFLKFVSHGIIECVETGVNVLKLQIHLWKILLCNFDFLSQRKNTLQF